MKETSLINWPSHRHRDRKSQSLHLRCLNFEPSQLLVLGMQCSPQLLPPLSLLMGHTPQATVEEATVWAKMPLKVHAHPSLVVVTYTGAGWTTRPDGTSQGGQLVFIANAELLQGKESSMSLISGHSNRLKRVARSSSAAEAQPAADGDDEAVYIRLCVKEVPLGQLELQNWQPEAEQILAALVVGWRDVYDALARSSSSCLDLKDKKSGLEALALKQSPH